MNTLLIQTMRINYYNSISIEMKLKTDQKKIVRSVHTRAYNYFPHEYLLF